MFKLIKKPIKEMGFNFVKKEFLPIGKDEFYLRNQSLSGKDEYRNLTPEEIETLIKNDNQADDWNYITVKNNFDPSLVKRCRLKGIIRIGNLHKFCLEYHDLQVPVGLYDSTIVSCDFGDDVSVNNVSYLSHYQISDEVILFNLKEMITTSKAKFGNGILKDGEKESSRIKLELGNENGGRSVLPFNGILPADIYLWYKFKGDHDLQKKFLEFTEDRYDTQRGYYGQVGKHSIIKNCLIIKDVKVGEAAYIKGANKLKNLTINSSEHARTQIGEGVEAVNGIIGLGCRIFYGVKAVRFVMGQASQLKYGARLINSYLGDNSTISCCEVLNSFIYPFHEQHHNNSFLCAASLYGQTNLAAGATIGSNHNSRSADGEIVAGRGFWPGLCVSLKHNSRFASFILLPKGDFPSEVDIQLPFSLVSNNVHKNELQIMPAYWFMYNMYALARNSWKYASRDKRTTFSLDIEQDYLAPDSVNEIFIALEIMEVSVGKAFHKKYGASGTSDQEKGKYLLNNESGKVDELDIFVENAENSRRNARLVKCAKAYQAYKNFVVLYGIQNLLKTEVGGLSIDKIKQLFKNCQRKNFVNLGGQLMSYADVDNLRKRIKNGEIESWNDLHASYTNLRDNYANDKLCHSIISMLEVSGLSIDDLNEDQLKGLIDQAVKTKKFILKNTIASREKDHENYFRKMMYETDEEMDEVIGKFSENSFVELTKKETLDFNLQVSEKFGFVIPELN